jgi:hypothetical protein
LIINCQQDNEIFVETYPIQKLVQEIKNNCTCIEIINKEKYLSTKQLSKSESYITKPIYDQSQDFHNEFFNNHFAYKVEDFY